MAAATLLRIVALALTRTWSVRAAADRGARLGLSRPRQYGMHRPNISALSLYSAAAMAVPKRKTSKSRRDKRRATHKVSIPALVECPQCHQPKRPHHVCPTCGTYRGREVAPLRTTAP
jgi:large subunit ribosomal protein L32